MYKEIALDPACMADFEYYQLIKQDFGFDKGRYLVADIKTWAREAILAVKESNTLKPVREKSIKNFLNKLARAKEFEGFVLTKDRKGLTFSSWNEWWLQQKEIRDFDLTLSENYLNTITIDEILDDVSNENWRVSPSKSVLRKTDEIVSSLLPLIQISEKVVLIDQYFRVDCNLVLESLFKILSEMNVREFTVVSALNNDNLARVYNEKYQSMTSESMKFSWVKAPDKFFHARFFITDKGAITSDYGFMEATEKGAHSDFAIFGRVGKDDSDRTLESLKMIIDDSRASSVTLPHAINIT